jgi:DHA1 family multidrug resistance protein-like MFS transporter
MIDFFNRPQTRILLLEAVFFLFWMALNLFVPTLPVYINTFTDNFALIGITISMYGLCGTFIRLPIGVAADWLGRCKPLIFAGILLAGLGTWLMGSAPEISFVIVGRAITGLAAASGVLLIVLFCSFFLPEDAIKATAILSGIIAASRLFASFFTGWLNEWGGYPLAFFVSSGLAGVALLLLIPIRESQHRENSPSLRGLVSLLARRDVFVSSLLNAIGQYTLMASVWGFIPILAQRMGAGNVQISLLVTVHIVFIILGSLIASRHARLVKERGMLTISFVLMAAGIGLAALAPSLNWIFAAQVIHGYSIGLSYPVLMGLAIENVPADERSTALGLHQSIYAIGLFAGPWLSGILADSFGIQPMFATTALACLILGVIGVRWLFNEKIDNRAKIE